MTNKTLASHAQRALSDSVLSLTFLSFGYATDFVPRLSQPRILDWESRAMGEKKKQLFSPQKPLERGGILSCFGYPQLATNDSLTPSYA